MTSIIIDMFLLSLLVFIAVMILRTGKLFAVIVMSGGYSLTSAVIFVNLDAVDVAFTEAAVGAGISTVLFLAAMSFLPSEEKVNSKSGSRLVGLIAYRLRGCRGAVGFGRARSASLWRSKCAGPSACGTEIFGREWDTSSYPQRGDNGFGQLSRI